MPFVTVVIAAVLLTLVLMYLCVRQRVRQRKTIQTLNVRIAEQADGARRAQQHQDLLFSANPYPMFIYDRSTLRFLDVNDATLKAYGYSREEFLAMSLADIRPEQDKSEFLHAIRQRHAGYTRPGVSRHLRKDGSVVMAEIMAFQYDKEEASHEMVLALDISEQYRMQEALRESETRLKILIDNAPFGIAQSVMGQDKVGSVNPALLRILGGYSADEVLQLSISREIYADSKERERLMDVLRRDGQLDSWETNLRRRDGTLVPVRISGSVSGDNGTPEIFSTYIEDMTQQSKLEQQIRQVQKLEAVGRLAGGIAHDFNNILVVIKLSTEMMLAQVTPESPFSKSLLQISTAADRAAALTRQVLAFGRQQMLQTRIINLNTVVTETTQMLRRVIGEDVQLVTKLGKNVENSCLDPDQVTQVILNLAVNARDAMPEGGTLHIETDTVELDEVYAQEHAPVQPGRYVMLAVSDTGTGIEKSVQPRIFDPFFTTKEMGKGTGLGLSIVYGIVKQSGGYIWLYSEPGHGTTFKLYFPATSAPVERPPSRHELADQVSGQLLLVVEDEAAIRANLCDCLQHLGYKVLEAENAGAALQVCEELRGEIDLVITDLVMAGKSGHELASELAERYPKIRVLFMSGYTEDTASRRDILLRGSPFLQKPFSVGDLAKAVHEALMMIRPIA